MVGWHVSDFEVGQSFFRHASCEGAAFIGGLFPSNDDVEVEASGVSALLERVEQVLDGPEPLCDRVENQFGSGEMRDRVGCVPRELECGIRVHRLFGEVGDPEECDAVLEHFGCVFGDVCVRFGECLWSKDVRIGFRFDASYVEANVAEHQPFSLAEGCTMGVFGQDSFEDFLFGRQFLTG